MGNNSFSKNQYGSVQMHLAQNEFYAGESIRGVIDLRIKKNFNCKRIALVFQGKFQKGQSDLKTSSSFGGIAKNAITDILNNDQMDQTYQGLIANHTVYIYNEKKKDFSIGDYSLPFSLETDKFLPNSTKIYMSSARFIKISYHLTCGVESFADQSHLLFQRKSLQIIQKSKVQSLPKSVTEKIVLESCFTSRKIELNVEVNKSDINFQKNNLQLILKIKTDEPFLPFKRAKIALCGELFYKKKKYIWQTFHLFYINVSNFKKISLNQYEATKNIENLENFCSFQSKFVSYNNFIKISFQTNYVFLLNSTVSRNDTVLKLNFYKESIQKLLFSNKRNTKRKPTVLSTFHEKLNEENLTSERMQKKISLIKQSTIGNIKRPKSKSKKILPQVAIKKKKNIFTK